MLVEVYVGVSGGVCRRMQILVLVDGGGFRYV